MQNEPWKLLLMLSIGLYVVKLWFDDFRAQRAGQPNPRALPGSTATTGKAIALAAIGGLILVSAETWGEIHLGIADEQSKMGVLFAAYTLVAAIVEEIIFRGYIVIEKQGRHLLWASAFVASLLFAILHPFLWHWEGGMPWTDGHLAWTFGLKGWFSTAVVFASSLWFYCVRFARFNQQKSLLPCFAAHGVKNLAVIVIKAAQGFLTF